MRKALLAVFAAAFTLTSASTALARGGGWEPLPANPFDFDACGSTLHIEFPENKEFFKLIPQEDGTTLFKVTGKFKMTVTDVATGATLELVNVSGPGRSLIYPNGDFEFIASGLNVLFLTGEQSAATGLPNVFVTSGTVDYLFRADGTVEVLDSGNIHSDICAELTEAA